MYVYSCNDGMVVNNVGGGTVMMRQGEVWAADDPFVLARPDLFSSDPPLVRRTVEKPATLTPAATRRGRG